MSNVCDLGVQIPQTDLGVQYFGKLNTKSGIKKVSRQLSPTPPTQFAQCYRQIFDYLFLFYSGFVRIYEMRTLKYMRYPQPSTGNMLVSLFDSRIPNTRAKTTATTTAMSGYAYSLSSEPPVYTTFQSLQTSFIFSVTCHRPPQVRGTGCFLAKVAGEFLEFTSNCNRELSSYPDVVRILHKRRRQTRLQPKV